MCTKVCMSFGKSNLSEDDIKGKDVIEIGSYNVNGSIRGFVTSLNPNKYIGVDMREGPGVDIVCDANDIVERFGEASFDVVISTDTMEHIENWRGAMSNFKRVCKSGGIMIITTVSKGYGKHDYPSDFWRYELSDMERIFFDCKIEKIEADPKLNTIFVRVRKPNDFIESDLRVYELYRVT